MGENMTADIDNVSKKILDDAALEREKNLNSGRERALAVLKETENRRKKLLDEGKQKASEKYREVYNLEILKAKTEFRQKILLYKLEIVDRIIEKAKNKLAEMGREDYIKFIKKSLVGSGIMEGTYLIGRNEKRIDDKTMQSILEKVHLKKSNNSDEFETGLKIFNKNVQYHISPETLVEAEIDDIKMEIAFFLFDREVS
jgi:V/A-type H+-transporting ATPase subunit E